VALTALAMAGDRERCMAAGATDYISKPVKLKALADMVKRLVSNPGNGEHAEPDRRTGAPPE
jgi:CheY-like chemotaxis protein